MLTLPSFTVVDEADELLDADWEDDFKKIMSGGGEARLFNTLYFSRCLTSTRRQRGRGPPIHDVLGHLQQRVPQTGQRLPLPGLHPRPHWPCRQCSLEHHAAGKARVLSVHPSLTANASVVHQVIYVDEGMKKKALYDLLMSMVPIRTLIFVNSRDQVDFVDDFLYNSGLPSTSIHGGRTQREREDAM